MRLLRRPWRFVLLGITVVAVVLPMLVGTNVSLTGASVDFQIGAAQVDITPPALDTAQGQALDAAEFVPRCGISEAQIAQLWPGRRLFAFEDPYIDKFGAGQYVPGDPYCDADGTHRYEAPYIGGGAGINRWPLTSADTNPNFNPAGSATNEINAAPGAPACPPTGTAPVASPCTSPDAVMSEAVAYDEGGHHLAVVSVDSIGIFDSTMDQIRADVNLDGDTDLSAANIFISSTHDESAPDPIGLWGPGVSGDPSPVNEINGDLPAGVSSGVDDFYMNWMAGQVAKAVVQADTPAGSRGPLGSVGTQTGLQPAELKVTTARMPPNEETCWSSYPFVDDNLMPVMQGVSTATGDVIFTLVNVGTHNETLGFSGNSAYTAILSGDWAGRLRESLETDYPGSVGLEMAGLVGSVETPALYPEGTQVINVPGALHNVPGNPTNGCSSIYPEPSTSPGSTIAPYSDALSYTYAYGKSVADDAVAALVGSDATADPVVTVTPDTLEGQTRQICLQLENNDFAVAYADDLFPDRPAYADPGCTVGVSLAGSVQGPNLGVEPANTAPGAPLYILSEVGVVTMGPIQIAYSPGEVFPFTELGGPVDADQMPFPTNCYLPSPTNPTSAAAGDYTCGTPLPMTPQTSAEMTTPFRFMAGLGEDMVGYMFPPGNFVGGQGETTVPPYSVYEDTVNFQGNFPLGGDIDRFGYGHADDEESVGPQVGLVVTDALQSLLSEDGTGLTTVPGLYVDGAGQLCDSPFPAETPQDTGGSAGGTWVTGCIGFTGAVGVRVAEDGAVKTIDIGTAPGDASAWATYFGSVDTGTSGTDYPYSTVTRGVITDSGPLLIDVFSGAQDLGFQGE